MTNMRQKFGLSPDASPAAVRARWREIALQHHPDRGGLAITFNQLREDYQAALAEALAPQRCIKCGGTGQKTVASTGTHGFHYAVKVCPKCGGKGEIHHEDS